LGTPITSILQDFFFNTSLDGQISDSILLVDVQYGWDVSSNPPPLNEQVNQSVFQQMSSFVVTVF
jgi:hypothetical protein